MQGLTTSQPFYSSPLPVPQPPGSYTVISTPQILRAAGAEPCGVQERTLFLWGPRKNNVVNYKVDIARLRDELTREMKNQSTFMGISRVLLRPAIVAAYPQERTRRVLCIDLDYKPGEGAAQQVDYRTLSYDIWAIIRRHANESTPEDTTVYMSGASLKSKPVSLHLFFPEYETYQRFTPALVSELNGYLARYHLDCDAKIAGLKFCFSDKATETGYRGSAMEPVYYYDPHKPTLNVYWDEWARVSCPISVEEDARLLMTFKRDERAQLRVPLTGGPVAHVNAADLPAEVGEVWQYYLTQYAPDARIAKYECKGNPPAHFIGTQETHNQVCPHKGNNHWIQIRGDRVTVGCNGNQNSKRFKTTLAQIRQYMRTVQQPEPMDLDEPDFLDAFVAFVRDTECDVTTPVIKAQFEALGEVSPPYALSAAHMSKGSLIDGRFFSKLKEFGDDDLLVKYLNLGVGFATTTGLYVLRLPNGKVQVGVSEKTVKNVMACCQVIPEGEKKPKSVFGTWLASVHRSMASTVNYTMQQTVPTYDAFNIRMVPAITPALARRKMSEYAPERAAEISHTVKAWWDILLKGMCCKTGENQAIFYEWIELWCAETIFGSDLIGLYLQIYEPRGGVGKSRLGETLMSILGRDMCIIVKNVRKFIEDRWSSGRVGRRLMYADDAELPPHLLAQFNSVITSPQFAVEFKGGTQANNFPNYLSSLILTNELKQSGGTERERRMCLSVAGPYYGPECAEYTAENRAVFGDTLDSFLGWGFKYMTTMTGRKPSAFLYALVLHLEEVYTTKGSSEQVIEWLRLRVQNGDLRTTEKDTLAESLYGEVGDWIVNQLSADGSGHLYHESMEWNPNTLFGDRSVHVMDNWPPTKTQLSMDLVNNVPFCNETTDVHGRYHTIPTATLFKAFRMAGYRSLNNRSFTQEFIKAFNGLSQLWYPQRSADVFVTCARSMCSVGVASSNEGTYFVSRGSGARAQMRTLTLDYSAVDLHIEAQMHE